MKLSRSVLVCAAFVGALLIFCRPLTAGDVSNAKISAATPGASPRAKTLLDQGWRFSTGDFSNSDNVFAKATAVDDPASPDFNDSAWQQVGAPPFWSAARDSKNHGGWYRREISGITKSDERARFALDFDGIFGACQIWVNGYFVGRHDGGCAPFWFAISDYLDYGGRNVLALRVAALSSERVGIARRVWLTKTAPLHIAHLGTFVRTEIVPSHASIIVQSTLQNETDADAHCDVVWQVLDAKSRQIAMMVQSAQIPARGSKPVDVLMSVEKPELWSPDTPHLCSLITKVMQNGKVVDETRTSFGIRTIALSANHQLLLNGTPVEIKIARGEIEATDDAQMRSRLAALKASGANAYRSSHGAPSRELLAACDEMGIFVIEENRYPLNQAAALDALGSIILRDRNHPCVIGWSLGFDEENAPRSFVAARIFSALKRLASQLDPTRPMIDANGKNISSPQNAR